MFKYLQEFADQHPALIVLPSRKIMVVHGIASLMLVSISQYHLGQSKIGLFQIISNQNNYLFQMYLAMSRTELVPSVWRRSVESGARSDQVHVSQNRSWSSRRYSLLSSCVSWISCAQWHLLPPHLSWTHQEWDDVSTFPLVH